MLDAGHRRGQRPPRPVRGEVTRENAAARVAVAQGDDLAAPGVHAGQHDRRLDGLGAAVGEERLLEPPGRDLGQAPRHLDLVLGEIQRRGVPQPAHLVAHALDHLADGLGNGIGLNQWEEPFLSEDEARQFGSTLPIGASLEQSMTLALRVVFESEGRLVLCGDSLEGTASGAVSLLGA